MKLKTKYVCLGAAVLAIGGIGLSNCLKGEVIKGEEFSRAGNLLAMYIEDDAGDYVLNSGMEFPKDGYSLNLEKSSCTNGGVLSQDKSTKMIRLEAPSIDSCTLYFMKDSSRPVIKSVNFLEDTYEQTVLFNSIKLEEDVLIKEYYLSINGGKYQKISIKDIVPHDFCSNNSLVADNVKFSMYVVSDEGKESEPYDFEFGSFMCFRNVSISTSTSESESSSVSESTSASASASESESRSVAEEHEGGGGTPATGPANGTWTP